MNHVIINSDFVFPNPEIDAQHKEIYLLSKNIDSIINANSSTDKVVESLKAYYQKLQIHFDAEDALIDQFLTDQDNKHIYLHRSSHQDILSQMAKVISNIERDKTVLGNVFSIRNIFFRFNYDVVFYDEQLASLLEARS